MVPGVLHRLEHGGIGRRAVDEQGDLVPVCQRASAHRFDDGAVAFQHVRRSDGFLQPLHQGLAFFGRQQSFRRKDLRGVPGGRLIDHIGNLRQGRTSAAGEQHGDRQQEQQERLLDRHGPFHPLQQVHLFSLWIRRMPSAIGQTPVLMVLNR